MNKYNSWLLSLFYSICMVFSMKLIWKTAIQIGYGGSPAVGATRWGSSLGSTGGMGPQRVFFEALYPAVKKIPNSSVTSALVSGSSANLFPSFSPSVLSPQPVLSLSGSSVLLTPHYNLFPTIAYSQGLWEDTQLANWNSPIPMMLWRGWLFRHCLSLVGHLALLPSLPCQSSAAGVCFIGVCGSAPIVWALWSICLTMWRCVAFV